MNPVVVQALAPLLAEWIESSRDAAIAAGVERVPPAVRAALEGYVPESVLEQARWRPVSPEESLFQDTVVRFGDVPAMTFGHVVVFRDAQKAREDATLWAHELKHVMQFHEWGVAGFAKRYLEDYEAVELEAAEFRWEFMKSTGRIPAPSNQD